MNGERAAKASNMRREYWSSRYARCMIRGPFSKRLTHRYERQQGKRQLLEEAADKIAADRLGENWDFLIEHP